MAAASGQVIEGADDGTFVIETPEQLRAIADPFRQRLLQELAQPATARLLAQRLKQPQTRLYHHLDQLLRAGLIKVVREEKRRAMVERTFATAARRFAVSPAALAGGGSGNDRQRVAREIVESLLQDSSSREGGLRIIRARARLGEAALADLETRFAELLRDLDDPDGATTELVLMVSIRK